MSIPIIDLFAGPGGLGEGFSAVRAVNGSNAFKIVLSIEKDTIAHQTLCLRAAFRYLRSIGETDSYYAFLRGEVSYDNFLRVPVVAEAMGLAAEEAQCVELGKVDAAKVDRWISSRISGARDWVLIGGPPCQAYSLAGRARRTNDEKFEEDEKHFLYRTYLRVIRAHKPPVFVMENVKGMLSSTHGGNSIFSRIEKDLSSPSPDLRYEIRSFTTHANGEDLSPDDYVIESESHGVPQRRHRVILLGVRSDLNSAKHSLLRQYAEVSVKDVLSDMPRIRSAVSKRPPTDDWGNIVSAAPKLLTGWKDDAREEVLDAMDRAIAMGVPRSTGHSYMLRKSATAIEGDLGAWLHDPKLEGFIQHEARSHMASDLQRYLFASSFAKVAGRTPKLRDFPSKLLPEHKNIARENDIPFVDRFRVQIFGAPATTVVSHIAKDGHYYIHPDPSQCRSLTVREAARLQTFPDNYFFAGNRTQQYTQVGNAVPPFLAKQLGGIVLKLLQQRP